MNWPTGLCAACSQDSRFITALVLKGLPLYFVVFKNRSTAVNIATQDCRFSRAVHSQDCPLQDFLYEVPRSSGDAPGLTILTAASKIRWSYIVLHNIILIMSTICYIILCYINLFDIILSGAQRPGILRRWGHPERSPGWAPDSGGPPDKICIYIYIYREREIDMYVCVYVYIYLYLSIYIYREREIDRR